MPPTNPPESQTPTPSPAPAPAFGQPGNPAPAAPPPPEAIPFAAAQPPTPPPPSPEVKQEVANILSQTPAGPSPVPYGSAKPKRSKLPLVIILLVILLVGAGFAAYHFGYIKSPFKKPAPAPTLPPAPSTEDINANFTLLFTAHPGAAQAGTKLKIDFTALTTLRTQIAGIDCRQAFANSPQFVDCLRFSFANTLGGNQDLSATSSMEVDEVTSWLSADEKAPGPVFGLTKATDKQAKVNFLLNLKSTTDFSKVTTDQFPGLVGNASYVGGLQRTGYIETADKTFHGLVFVTNPGQTNTYNPQTLFIMAGKIGTETLLLRGNFRLNDKLSQKIAADTASGSNSTAVTQENTDAINNFKAGKLETDLPAIDDSVREMVKSLTLATR